MWQMLKKNALYTFLYAFFVIFKVWNIMWTGLEYEIAFQTAILFFSIMEGNQTMLVLSKIVKIIIKSGVAIRISFRLRKPPFSSHEYQFFWSTMWD